MSGSVYPSYAKAAPKLVGGALALDFVNTAEWRGDRENRCERLTNYAELLFWAEAAGAIDHASAKRLAQRAKAAPEEATEALARALDFREALARLFAGQRGQADLRLLNQVLAAAPGRIGIAAQAGGYAWSDARAEQDWSQPLWPVAWNAAELLTSGRRAQIRTCGDPRCAWMFLDLSRTRNRRWCSMESCGNRAKARRHYARTSG